MVAIGTIRLNRHILTPPERPLSAKKWVVVLIGCTVLFRGLAFLRELLIAHYFGTSVAADAYYIAFLLPGYFFTLLANGTLANALVPDLLHQQDHSDRSIYTGLITFAVLGSAFSLLLIIAAPAMTVLFFSGLDSARLMLAIRLAQSMAPAILFITVSIFLSAVAQALEKFVPAALCGLLFVAIIVMSVLLSPHIGGIYTVAFGVVVGSAFQATALWKVLRRVGNLAVRPHALDWKLDYRLLINCVPVVGASLYLLAMDLLVRYFASQLGPGNVSAVIYATKLIVFPGFVVGIPTATVFLPRLSRLFSTDRMEFDKTWRMILGYLIVALIPFAVFTWLWPDTLVLVLFRHGAFTTDSARLTASALRAFSPAILFGPVTIVQQTIFYSRRDVRTPLLAGWPLISTFCLGGWLLQRLGLGPQSVAYGYSAAWLASSLFLMARLVAKTGYSGLTKTVVFVLKVAFAAMGAIVVNRIVFPSSYGDTWHQLVQLAAAAIVFSIFYVVFLCIGHVIRLSDIKSLLRTRLAAAEPVS